jgi:hypothetical protein
MRDRSQLPPGASGKELALLGALPGALRVALASFRFKPLRQTPMAFGWMAKHGVPDDLLAGWLKGPWSRKEIRRDALKYIRSAREGRRRLQAATGHLSSYTGPVTVVWAKEDRVMPISEGCELAAAFRARGLSSSRTATCWCRSTSQSGWRS